MDYKNRLQQALNLRKKDRIWLAAQLNMTSQGVWMVLHGKTKCLSVENHMQAAIALDINAYWLATGLGEMINLNNVDLIKKVPVINLSQASDWQALSTTDNSYKRMICPEPCGQNTYAVKIIGESMSSGQSSVSFNPGQIVFVDPDIKPAHGDYVVVKIKNQNDSVFRRLIVDGEQYYLETINRDWPERIVKLDASADFCGVYVGTWTPKT